MTIKAAVWTPATRSCLFYEAMKSYGVKVIDKGQQFPIVLYLRLGIDAGYNTFLSQGMIFFVCCWNTEPGFFTACTKRALEYERVVLCIKELFCLFPNSKWNAAMERWGEGVQQRALLVLAGLGCDRAGWVPDRNPLCCTWSGLKKTLSQDLSTVEVVQDLCTYLGPT